MSGIPLQVERRLSDRTELESSLKGENRRGENLSQHLAKNITTIHRNYIQAIGLFSTRNRQAQLPMVELIDWNLYNLR